MSSITEKVDPSKNDHEVVNTLRQIISRNCKEETPEPVEGKVSGSIPKWIRGTLARNGPGMIEIGDDRYNHYFDGLALIHCFNIADGQVKYRNKFLRSETYKKNIKANRIVVAEFGTAAHPDPCATLFDRFKSTFTTGDFTDNDLVNIIQIGDSYYAATETNIIHKIDHETADTKEQINLTDYVAVNTATAHPHWENDGTVYNLGNSFSGRPSYNFIKFPASQKDLESFEKASVVCKIPCSLALYPSYYHSFAMTENYLILAEQSLILNIPKLFWNRLRNNAMITSLQWQPNQLVNFIVVDKTTGKQLSQKFIAEPFVTFHHGNAYEENGHIVMDLCAYPNGDIVNALSLPELERGNMEYLIKNLVTETRRYVLPLECSKDSKDMKTNLVTLEGTQATANYLEGSIMCKPENLCPELESFEFPQTNYEFYNQKNYNFLYGTGRQIGDPACKLCKINVREKNCIVWSEDGKFPGEPIFVPSPNSQSEDDGVLLVTLLHKDDEKRVTLLILDAKNMTQLGRCEFEAKSAVTSTFHGPFIAKKD